MCSIIFAFYIQVQVYHFEMHNNELLFSILQLFCEHYRTRDVIILNLVYTVASLHMQNDTYKIIVDVKISSTVAITDNEEAQ